jgi:Integrase/Phage integrase, N-terminal
VDNLTFSLRQLCLRNRDGSHATQADRLGSLKLMAEQLRELGFRQLVATSLSGKHVDALLSRWKAEGLSVGTIKNRVAHLRWWAEKAGKRGLVPLDNAKLGIPQRVYGTDDNKAWKLDEQKLTAVADPYIRVSLQLEQAFGLRREEAIKFRPSVADRGNHIYLTGSWTKGGRERVVPITTAEQRVVLDEAHRVAGAGSLIPADRNYIRHRNVYDGQCKSAGFRNMHGLRHGYAQARYEALTGWKAPKAGGPSMRALIPMQREMDAIARDIISNELGHSRLDVTKTYLGC